MAGWIKLHRSLKEWEYYDDPNVVRLLIHLLVTVNYEAKKWRGINVEPGDIITSYENIGVDLRLSKQQVRSALSKLEKSGEITRQRTRHCLHISLVKWDKLQAEQPDDNPRINPTITREQPDDNPTITPTKEGKEIEEGKEVKKKERKAFSPPSIEEVQAYCTERENAVNAQNFVDFYTSKNWFVGKNKMKDWKAAVRTWENRNKENNGTSTKKFESSNERHERISGERKERLGKELLREMYPDATETDINSLYNKYRNDQSYF